MNKMVYDMQGHLKIIFSQFMDQFHGIDAKGNWTTSKSCRYICIEAHFREFFGRTVLIIWLLCHGDVKKQEDNIDKLMI